MNESDRRQRVISSTPRLSTDEIANRTFAKGVRGFSETEVRAFLKRIADEIAAARGHEQELEAAIDTLEEQVRTPRALTEQELLDALGEETARLLRSAREASDDIRRKAEERAARLLDESNEAADRTRAEAHDLLAHRTAEAEAKSSELSAVAEARASSTLESAKSDSEAILESARHQGREMLDEAKAARERVLGDLVRRRSLLNGQIEALRVGRDRLLDAYRTVKGTFLEATEALAQVEARAAVERLTSVSEPIDLAAEIASEIEKLDGADGPLTPAEMQVLDVRTAADADETPGDDESVERVQVVAASSDDSDVATALADVDTLFARLRAGHDEPTAATPAIDVVADDAGDAQAPPAPAPVIDGPKLSAQEWRDRRGKAIDPLLAPALKRAKRRAQDDQNALLDSVRRHKGRPSAQQVLVDANVARDDWVKVLREAIDRAYGAGQSAVGATTAAAGDDFAGEAVESVVVPLRERLTLAIDAGDGGDTGGLVERIGARYREWKNQSLERSISEVLASAWARGVYDAVPDEAVLWWIPFEEGRCSDCDDNALEPTVKGKQFPTGQALPPAHPGCKCLLVPAGLLEGK